MTDYYVRHYSGNPLSLSTVNAMSVLEYSKCNVGIDYSYNSSSVFWWIYFSIGPLPKYNPKIPVNRVNAIKYSDSFVRIMYSDELYSALLEVLPKKQRTALTCAYNIHNRD